MLRTAIGSNMLATWAAAARGGTAIVAVVSGVMEAARAAAPRDRVADIWKIDVRRAAPHENDLEGQAPFQEISPLSWRQPKSFET